MEYKEVLSRPKFKFKEKQINEVIENIKNKGIFIDRDYINIELPDEKDRIFSYDKARS